MVIDVKKNLDDLWLEVVIWLETHVTITDTKTKLFCSCANANNVEPNTDICPVCTWQMGVLPLVNEEVVKNAVVLSKVLWWEVSNVLSFDRKHYSYPDLPKGYQLTQYRNPISKWGYVSFMRKDGTEGRVDISHFHIEEDPAKLTHLKGKTHIDYNRSWKPLFEIVTTPSIHSIEDAITYMEQLQKIVRYLGVSDADMEKGHFKSDISVSLRKAGEEKLNPRTEIKNLNSFKFALQALHKEVEEQIGIWKDTKSPQKTQQTKGWRDWDWTLEVMRKKETISDYKFMEEPDIPDVDISDLPIKDIEFDLLPYAVEKNLMWSWLTYDETLFFSSNIDKVVALYTIAWDRNIYDVAKVLINIPYSSWFDHSISTNTIKWIFDAYFKNENFDQNLLKLVFEGLRSDGSFDFESFIKEKTVLTDDLKQIIDQKTEENNWNNIWTIIWQLVKENLLPKNFSRTAVIQYLQEKWLDKWGNVEKGVSWNKNSLAKKEYQYDYDTFLNKYRTHSFSELSEELENKKVTVAWWIQSIRDHWDLVFIDLRCEWEVLQVQIDRKSNIDLDQITQWANESVISVEGSMIKRDKDDINPRLRLWTIELKADQVNLLSWAQITPFEITQSHNVNESMRMTYRYLDLRNPRVIDNIVKRHKITQYIRNFFDNNGFLHVDTPILGKPSDEGSREFFVPSRLHPHSFYTLPQAPQQLKQLLMWSGVDKYYQVARCFRDEDPKWDRQPEFTQIDMEMAYVKEDDIVNLITNLVLWMIHDNYPEKNILDETVPHYDYSYVMEHYGIDKPDLRYGLKMYSVTDIVKDSWFKVFTDVVKGWGIIKAMRVEWWKDMFSKKYVDSTLREFVQKIGWWGLANFHVWGESNFVEQKLWKEVVDAIIEKTGAKEWDTLLFAADQEDMVNQVLSQARQKIAQDYKLFNENDISLLWVRNFPMFEKTDEGKWKFTHNPFSMPKIESLDNFLAWENIPNIIAQQYDIVMNGSEIGWWSIRAHLPQLLQQTYKIMWYTPEETKKSVWHIIDAFQYGFPPHGWLALWLDRILMILQWHDTIREVIPFPKTWDAKDLLMNAPSAISDETLKDTHIKLLK